MSRRTLAPSNFKSAAATDPAIQIAVRDRAHAWPVRSKTRSESFMFGFVGRSIRATIASSVRTPVWLILWREATGYAA
jgi:hypothetical protein